MMKPIHLLLLLSVVLGTQAFAVSGNKQTLTPVKVYFIEALDPKDTTSSTRFRNEYELAISTGKKMTASRLSSCGYELDTSTIFYGASDPIQAKESAEKSVKDSTWFIVGPRRSNHYLLLAKGATTTPTVSIMASSEEVASLGDLHLSMVPSNSKMARAAAKEALNRINKKGNRFYISVVSSDCMFCKDFARYFDDAATKMGLKKKDEVGIIGKEPDTSEIVKSIEKSRPDFILLPNYSIVTSYLISKLQPVKPDMFFVGGDGWGTSNFGFVQKGRDVSRAVGFTVRGNPPNEEGFKSFALGKSLLQNNGAEGLSSATAMTVVRIMDSAADFLCKTKPKNREAFKNSFVEFGKKYFSAPWGVSIY